MSEEQRVVSDIVWTPEQGLGTPEVRGISWNNLLLTDDFYGSRWRTDSGVRINADTALQSTVLLACCRILSETIAGLPVHVYRRLPGGDEIASEIPLYKVLSFAPNHWQTKFEFFEQQVMHLCLWGNSYTRIRSGKYGSVSELDNLHPINMQVERLENGRLRYSYSNPETGRIERYNQDQVMHIRWTAEADGIKGMVPIQIAREAIALARACEIHAAKFWANSARPGVVLQTDGTLSAEAAQQLRDNWERIHAGVNSAYKTAVLTGGLKATELGFTNEASQFVASRQFQCEEIARVYRLPMSLLKGESGGNLEISGKEFVTHTLMPWLRRIESAISRSLIYDDDQFYARFDVKELLRGDSQTRAAYLSTMMNLGIYTLNDARRYEGLPPVGPDGDKHFISMNVQTLEDAVKPKPDPNAMMAAGGGSPPEAVGGKPSLSEVKTGEAPPEAPKGLEAEEKPEENSAPPSAGGLVEPATSNYIDAVEIEKPEYEDAIEVHDKKKPSREDAIEIRSETLSRQNQDLYDAQMKIVAKDGKWPQSGADGAHYMEQNPFAARGMACRNCVFFEKPNACHVVQGEIQANAICKLWVIPEERLSATESRSKSTISIDFDRTFARNPRLWGEFAKKSVEDGNNVVMISRREDTESNRKDVQDTLGDYAGSFSKVLLVGGQVQKEDAAREAGIKVDIWVDDSPQTIKGESRAFCATGQGGGIDNSCGSKESLAPSSGIDGPDHGGGGVDPSQSTPRGASTKEVVEEILRSIEATGGYSVHPVTAESPTTGFMCSTVRDAEKIIDAKEEVTEKLIENYFDQHKDYLSTRPRLHLGGWIDAADGKVYLDLSERFETEEEATKAAIEHKQIAIWDLKNKREIRIDHGNQRAAEADREIRLSTRRVGERNRRSDRGSPQEGRVGVRSGERPDARRLVDEASRLAGPPAKSKIVDIGKAAAIYDHVTDSLLVSATVDSRAFDKAAADGWVSQANPILHELAHRHHFKADRASYECAEFISLTEEQQDVAKRDVSRFAATNAKEFVAEVIAGSMSGKKYGYDVRSLLSLFTDGKVTLS